MGATADPAAHLAARNESLAMSEKRAARAAIITTDRGRRV